MAKWPHLCWVAEAPDGTIMGYIIGKTEGNGENWHGHVTAVTVSPEGGPVRNGGCYQRSRDLASDHRDLCCSQVAPEYRRLGLGQRFMDILEGISIKDDW